MIEANPYLTWRDVQYIFAKTSRMINPDDDDWVINRAGYHHSHRYGFGLIDAHAAVIEADSWDRVGAVRVHKQTDRAKATIERGGSVVRSIKIALAAALESVQVILTAKHPYSTDLRITLTSPANTTSILAEPHGFCMCAIGIECGDGAED
jgi:hypothetical protein